MNILDRYHAMEYGPAPEARNEADAWLAARDFGKALFIDGGWKAASGGKTFDTSEPSSGKLLAKVSDASAADIDAAVAAATKALPKWRASSGYARAKVLYAIGRAMQRHQRLFAVLESIDNGKPIRESRDIDVPLAIRHFIHHAGWAHALDRDFPGHKGVGVVGQIIPWNFPLLMLAWKIAPALAAGCTVVLKPAEFTPLTAILFAEICERAGVPKGVVNIVQGGPEAGAAIVNHPGIQKIAFTGSSEVGKIIRKATAGSGKKLSLELGGKSAFIVFEDADLDSAVEGLVDRSVVEHDVGGLAAQLEGHLLVGAGDHLGDRAPDIGRAGEGHLVDVVVGHQRPAGLAGAGHDVDDTGGQGGLLHDLGEEQCRERSELRRFDDDRASRRERGRDFPREHEQREVPRDDLPDDPRRVVSGELAVEQLRPAGVVIEVARDERHVDVTRLPDALAIVHRLEHGEQSRVALHSARERVQVPRASMPAERFPRRERLARCSDGGVDILLCPLRHLRDARARRRIADVEESRRLRPAAGDELAETRAMSGEPVAGRGVSFRRRTVLHGVEDLADGCHAHTMG